MEYSVQLYQETPRNGNGNHSGFHVEHGQGSGLGYIGCKAIARAWTSHQLEHAHTKDARA